jgi:pulcherriminic acid synthase
MGTRVDSSLIDDLGAVVAGDTRVDRHEVFARLRSEAPVFFNEALGAWVVSRYDDVRGALQANERFVPITEGPGSAPFGGGYLHWRGREHNKKAGIVARRIRAPRAMKEEMLPRVERIARQLAAELPLGEPIELRERYTIPFPLLVISELTGIEQLDKLQEWYDAIMEGGTSTIAYPERLGPALEAVNELKAYLAPILAERRRNPGDDLLSTLVTGTYEGEPLPEHDIVAVVAHLLPAGVETTERLLTSALRHLALDPPEWEAVRESRDDDDALASFGAEALRWYPPIQAAMRVAASEGAIGGVEIAAGDKLVLLLVSANRDEERFPEPQRFDGGRFRRNPDRQYTAAGEILPFGGGEHHCAGSRVAEAEIVHGLRWLLERVGRIELLDDAAPTGGLVLFAPRSLRVVLHAARAPV